MQNFGTQQKTVSLSRMYKIRIELFYLQKTKLSIKFKAKRHANRRSKVPSLLPGVCATIALYLLGFVQP